MTASPPESALPVQIVWIPGMAADERLFSPIDIPAARHHHLRWRHIPGATTLRAYAETIVAEADWPTDLPMIYVGSSMGGMLAVELQAVAPADDLVLLSAPATRREFPALMKALGRIRAGALFSPSGILRARRISDTFMGFKNLEDRQWFYENLEAYGPEFVHFAVNAILDWDRTTPAAAYGQIIGAQDRLFRPSKMHQPIVVPGAGHFLTKEQPARLTELLLARWRERFQD